MTLFALIYLTGCSSMKHSIISGAASGAALGAGAGAIASKKDRGKKAAISALVGAAIGAVSGHFIHKGLEERDDDTRRKTLFDLDKYNVSIPKQFENHGKHGLTNPKVESEWIETQVKGKKLIEGHRTWVITEDAQWIPSDEKKK